MSPRNALLLLLLAASLAAGQALPWANTSLYQIYAVPAVIQSSSGVSGYVWVPRFTPPPPPPGEAQACYIVLPSRSNLYGMLAYGSTWQQKYGLPVFDMGVYNYPSMIYARTVPCEALRYLQLIYGGSMSNAVVQLNITAPGVLVGAAGLGASPSSLSTTASTFSICNTSLTGFYVSTPGEYYVKLSGGLVYTVAANCTTYIYAVPSNLYAWNSSYTAWYNGKMYGIAFAVVFSAPCVAKPAVLQGFWSDIYGRTFLQFASYATWCGSSLIATGPGNYYEYYALLAPGPNGPWYRVNPGVYYDAVVPIPIAVNIGGRQFTDYTFAYYNYAGNAYTVDRQPIITSNMNLFAQQPGILTSDTANTLDIFLVDPSTNPSSTGIALFSMGSLPAGMYSAYILTDGGAAVFPLWPGKLSPLAVFAPAGANVISFMQINKTVYFAESVACPYPMNAMPPAYDVPGTAAYFNMTDASSYIAVQIVNGQPIPIYVAAAYPSPYAPVLTSHYAMSVRIDPFSNATIYGNKKLGLSVFYSLNTMCSGGAGVWKDVNFFADYGNKTVEWTGSGMFVINNTTPAQQIANLTQLLANYLANLTGALLTSYVKALANLTSAARSIPVPQAPSSVSALSVTTVQTALNALKSAVAAMSLGGLVPTSFSSAPLAIAPAASAAVAIAWAASRRDEDLTVTAAVAGIALALFGVLMTLLYGAGSLPLVVLGVIIAAAAAAWHRSSI